MKRIYRVIVGRNHPCYSHRFCLRINPDSDRFREGWARLGVKYYPPHSRGDSGYVTMGEPYGPSRHHLWIHFGPICVMLYSFRKDWRERLEP